MDNIIAELPFYKDKMEERHNSILAPFATKKPRENSRIVDEGERTEENRSDFQRDRDRIIHSKAFRRLQYKTQVFVNHEGDHYRTRLTHTLEVAQFARGICKSLALNEELAEAIALGHDLGHTPFGHAVERYLSKELKDRKIGHFYHNEQSVRVVDYLEKRCEKYKGLNLTYEVREGILKHNSVKNRSGIYQSLNSNQVCSTLEGQLVNIVDTIAYICHDLQDGIRSGLIEDAIHKNEDFKKSMNILSEIIAGFLGCEKDKIDFSRYSKTYFINDLIHKLILNLTVSSVDNLKNGKITSCKDVYDKAREGITLISFNHDTGEFFENMRDMIYTWVYGLHTIKTMDEKAVKVAGDLFVCYLNKPGLLPPEWNFSCTHLENDKLYDGAENNKTRVICDYISTMTDRFALEEHERLFNPRIKI